MHSVNNTLVYSYVIPNQEQILNSILVLKNKLDFLLLKIVSNNNNQNLINKTYRALNKMAQFTVIVVQYLENLHLSILYTTQLVFKNHPHSSVDIRVYVSLDRKG